MIFLRNFYNNKSGQAIIESVVAASLAVIGLLGMVILLSRSVAFNRGASGKLTATYLAAEGIEVMKNIVDENYTKEGSGGWDINPATDNYELAYDFSQGRLRTVIGDFSSAPLLFDSGTGAYGYESGTPTRFFRTVKVDYSPDGLEMKVKSIVRWTEKGEAMETNLEDHFYNWRP